MTRRKPIAVGVDGTEDGLRAVEYAASSARAEGRGVRLLHAFHVSAGLNPMLSLYGIESLREVGEKALVAAERRVGDVAPDVPVEHLLVAASPAPALVETSKTASMVVVGRSAIHGLSRLLSRSKSTAVAARAKCPVVSVPETWSPTEGGYRIVVGVDGSTAGRDSLAYAFELASARRSALMAVRAWEVPSRWYTDIPDLGGEAAEWLERVQLALAEDLAGWSEDFPDVPVSRVFERASSPAEALVRRSEGASLLVVGACGLGGVPGLDLGWTARSILAHASCPVLVVHEGDASRSKDGPLIPAETGVSGVS